MNDLWCGLYAGPILHPGLLSQKRHWEAQLLLY